jgi:hypothetical protein
LRQQEQREQQPNRRHRFSLPLTSAQVGAGAQETRDCETPRARVHSVKISDGWEIA